jgi:predicted dehydrogenase
MSQGEQAPESAPVSAGLVGFGKAAEIYHLPIIRGVPEIQLRKIVERHGLRSARRCVGARTVKDPRDLFQDPEIELVIITTPNNTHFELARQALEAGKHVLVEKPFTVDLADAARLCALAKERRRVLSVYHNRRWDSDFLTARRLIESACLGELVHFESRFERYRPNVTDTWRDSAQHGAGLCWEMAPHLIDQALVLFGEPDSVSADIRVQRANGLSDDCFEIILSYGRLKVTLIASVLVKDRGPRFVLHGTKGSWIKRSYDTQEESLKAGHSPLNRDNWGSDAPADWGSLRCCLNGLEFQGSISSIPGDYRKLYRNLARAIRKNEALEVSPVQAMATVRIIEAAFESSRTGRVVRLRRDGDSSRKDYEFALTKG